MITTEQQQAFEKLLGGKNLPLDLKLEIFDHMIEQAIYKTDIEEKSFEVTLQEINNNWKADLKFSRWPLLNRRTVFEQKVRSRNDWTITKKSLFYFALYTIISSILIFFDNDLAAHIIFTVHLLAVLAFVLHCLFEFKLVKTIVGNIRKKRISFMQAGAQIFFTASLLIVMILLPDFTSRFEKYADSLYTIIKFQSFSQVRVGSLLIYWIYDLMWICGYLYFLEYRKAVRFLQHKIHLKL